MSVTTSPTSKFVIEDETIPDGFRAVSIDMHLESDPELDGTPISRKQNLLFTSHKAEVDIPFAPSTRGVGYVIDTGWPPTNGGVLALESVGSLELFANETFRTDVGFVSNYTDLVTVNGVENPINDNIPLPSGGLVHISDSGALTYSPRNAFLHLAEGKAAVEQIPYTTEAPSPGVVNYWDDNEVNTDTDWVDQEGGWRTINFDEFPKTNYYTVNPAAVGVDSFLEFSVRNSTISDNTSGAIEVFAWDSELNQIGSRLFSITSTVRENHSVAMLLPEGTAYLALDANNGARMDLRIDSLTALVPAETKYLELTIKGSEDVGPELNSGLSWSGAGWSESNGVFTHTSGSTDPIQATVSGLQAGYIYQYTVSTQNATAGTVKLALGVNEQDWDIATNEPDLVMLRAGSSSETVKIIPSSDFDGEVTNVSLKLIKKHGDSAAALDFIKADGGTGKATLTWKIPTLAKFSDTQTPEKTHTGALEFSGEFGVRENDVINSMRVYDATSTAKRSGVSIKGGNWFEAENVMVIGGYPETAPSWKFQSGFVLCDNGKPTMKAQYYNHCYVDLLMAPMTDNYVTQNSDGFVVNGGVDRFYSRLYMYDCAAEGIPDGGVDQKIVGFINQMGAYGGHRSIRAHSTTHSLVMNSLTKEEENTECAYHMAYAESRANVFNCWHDGDSGIKRVYSQTQLAQLNDKTGVWGDTNALASDEPNNGGLLGLCVLLGYPRYPDFIRVHMTDMDFQISSDGGGSWNTLDLPFTNEQGVIAENRRTFSISAGTYSIRARCKNHDSVGEWEQVDNVVVA